MARSYFLYFASALFLILNIAPTAHAQDDGSKVFTQEQLEQIVSPIALHPDELVSQILMASTYPLEVVQADRWVKENESLEGDALVKALDDQPWDPSVKSLIQFPQVLDMMSTKLDWITDLGDAFIAQQADVLSTIQTLRAKAKDEGNLESNEQQTVTVDSGSTTQNQTIIIEASDPDVVYVPTYNPTVVYGSWPYPAYPPYYYYPPGYVARPGVAFGIGVAVGATWGYAWGNCNWRGGDIDIDINRNYNRNTNIRNSNIRNNNDFRNNTGNRNGKWNHDRNHRRGVSYRDQNTSQRFGKSGTRSAQQARESYRGRANSDRQSLNRSNAQRNTQRSGERTRNATNNQRTRSGSATSRRSSSGSALNRSSSGSSTRNSSNRGRSSANSSSQSRSSAGRSRSSGSRGGGSRGGGRRGR
jgi:Protein of unknown function (DUF3300)